MRALVRPLRASAGARPDRLVGKAGGRGSMVAAR